MRMEHQPLKRITTAAALILRGITAHANAALVSDVTFTQAG